MCVPDFPNLFVVYGPNTNLGGSSIINMLEAAAGAITTLLRHADATRAPARSPYVRRPRSASTPRSRAGSGTACGRPATTGTTRTAAASAPNWPGLVEEYQRRCAELDLRDFVTV